MDKAGVRYRKLRQDDSELDEDEVDGGCKDGFLASQFDKPPTKVPWKAVVYALVLFIMGTALLVAGCLIVTGHIAGVHYQERFWPLIILGTIMFLPGSYHTYFAYKALKGDPDWDFEEFPDF